MKKIILAGVVLLLVNATFAQHSVEFGIKAGLNFANLKDDANSSTEVRTGWHAGGLAHIHINRQFAIQPELMYSSQGAEYPGNNKLKFNYVNIPVLGQYMFGEGFRLQTGPQFGILASTKLKSGDAETDVDDGFKALDFAWSFGTGYLSPKGIGVDLRYNLGLSNISEPGPDLKNRVWQLGVFYQFKH
ncbi:MAG TPA: porin family protein [Chitinophagaceae bacterium]